MLYLPDGYEPLAGEWDVERVRAGIRAIVEDADAAYGAESLWPANDWDSWRTPTPLKMLYVGAAGVDLGARRAATTRARPSRDDLAAAAEETVAEWRREPDLMAEIELPSTKESGLLSGETGILLVAMALTGHGRSSPTISTSASARTRRSEAEDLMWGTPGTLVAARAMLERTGDERWREACLSGADALWSRRDDEGLWTQRLHGEEYRGSGRRTGSSATSRRCGRCSTTSDASSSSVRRTRCSRGLPFVEDGLANWAYIERPELASATGEIGCSGVPAPPGSSSPQPTTWTRNCCSAGAELMWRAGPADAGEGRRHLPRHGRQRLRAAGRVRAHRRRAVARAGAPASPPTPSARSSGARAATRSGPAASAPPSSPPTASRRGRATPFSAESRSGARPRTARLPR